MMSNAQQAKANSGSSIRSGGVLVNFPAPGVRPPASPSTHDADLPAVKSLFLGEESGHEFLLSTSQEFQRDDQSFSMPGRMIGSEPEPVTIKGPFVSNDEWVENPDSCALQPNSTPAEVQPKPLQTEESLAPPVAPIQPKRNWLERWLFPDTSEEDKRSGARKPAPGLIAHFFTGGPPKLQPVRDISATGMYVATEERWYPGTQILITLTKTLEDGPLAGRSITILATAVRWGNDGVGLEFVCNTARKTRRNEPVLTDGADAEQLGQFVEQFGATIEPGQGKRGKRKR